MSYRNTSTAYASHNVRVFNRLKSNAKKIAVKVSKDTAKSMHYSLSHRLKLGAGGKAWGQYPKWKPDRSNPNEPHHASKKSFRGWQINKRGSMGWAVYNDAYDATTGYHYPQALLKGKGWSPKVRTAVIRGGGETKRLILTPKGLFSKQLPQGLAPWVKYKRTKFKADLRKAFTDRRKMLKG